MTHIDVTSVHDSDAVAITNHYPISSDNLEATTAGESVQRNVSSWKSAHTCGTTLWAQSR